MSTEDDQKHQHPPEPVRLTIKPQEWVGIVGGVLSILGLLTGFIVKMAIYQERLDTYIRNNADRIHQIENRTDRIEQILIELHKRDQRNNP